MTSTAKENEDKMVKAISAAAKRARRLDPTVINAQYQTIVYNDGGEPHTEPCRHCGQMHLEPEDLLFSLGRSILDVSVRWYRCHICGKADFSAPVTIFTDPAQPTRPRGSSSASAAD